VSGRVTTRALGVSTLPSRLPSVRAGLRRRFRAAPRPTPFQISPAKLPREQP